LFDRLIKTETLGCSSQSVTVLACVYLPGTVYILKVMLFFDFTAVYTNKVDRDNHLASSTGDALNTEIDKLNIGM
jgi:hypothetical protein